MKSFNEYLTEMNAPNSRDDEVWAYFLSLKNKLIPEIEKVIEQILTSEFKADIYFSPDIDDEKRKKIKIAVAEILKTIASGYDRANNRLTM